MMKTTTQTQGVGEPAGASNLLPLLLLLALPAPAQAQDYTYLANLAGVFFEGHAPIYDPGLSVFDGDTNATLYYLPGAANWGATFGGRPAVLWNPVIQTTDIAFEVHDNQFRFNVTGTANIPIVVEAHSNLTSANWTEIQGGRLTNGSILLTDPAWTNYPARYYRIRSP
jgi:hypothetical protein